mgnify:CR=1 FL=1
MEYTKEIISLIAWPVLIYISYKLSVIALKFFDKKNQQTEN